MIKMNYNRINKLRKKELEELIYLNNKVAWHKILKFYHSNLKITHNQKVDIFKKML